MEPRFFFQNAGPIHDDWDGFHDDSADLRPGVLGKFSLLKFRTFSEEVII